jgi:hypothetical protein
MEFKVKGSFTTQELSLITKVTSVDIVISTPDNKMLRIRDERETGGNVLIELVPED